MPRYPEMPDTITPFGRVLIDYMWNRRPPMTTHQLAIKLGVPKQSTSNWVVRGVLPPFETIMAVLAKLDIPLSTLYSAYKEAGILMPRWDQQDTAELPSAKEMPPTPRTRKATVVPIQLDDPHDAPAPLPYTPPPPVPSQDEEWDLIIRNTQTTLRNDGVSEAAIAAILADLRRQQRGESTPIQRSLIAEHSEPAEKPEPERQTERKAKNPANR